jgi:hypothetical protein
MKKYFRVIHCCKGSDISKARAAPTRMAIPPIEGVVDE